MIFPDKYFYLLSIKIELVATVRACRYAETALGEWCRANAPASGDAALKLRAGGTANFPGGATKSANLGFGIAAEMFEAELSVGEQLDIERQQCFPDQRRGLDDGDVLAQYRFTV
jgi:hypothetical protein